MTGAVRPPPRGILLAAAGMAAALGLAAAPHDQPPLALINETPSVPRGFYVRSPDPEPRLGRLVAIAQPAAARPYLVRLGVPSDMRLLKRVAATGGDTVCAAEGVLRTPRGQVAVPPRDRRGAPLPVWRGCRTLAADELLFLGDTATSFDGRYFGPLRRTQVEATYREVLRW